MDDAEELRKYKRAIEEHWMFICGAQFMASFIAENNKDQKNFKEVYDLIKAVRDSLDSSLTMRNQELGRIDSDADKKV